MDLTLQERHERCLYPCVRVRSGKALGSGTVLYVEPAPGAPGMHDWYVLTNEHVVDDLIRIERRWSSLLKREVPMDVLGTPIVEVFTYAYTSRTVGSTGFQATIEAYDKAEDLALLRVRAPYAHPHVARIIPEAEIETLQAFMPVWNVGCGLGEKPVITAGYLSAFGVEIEEKDYFMVTAPSIFGNSGGATFLQESGAYIGVPARISVASLGFSPDLVTHMGFSITAARIYGFLRGQIFGFIIDPACTSAACAEERTQRREQDARRRMREEE